MIFSGSRYVTAPKEADLTSEGVVVTTLGTRVPSITTSSTDETHIFREGDRLDLISYMYYGDAQLGWAILDANGYFSEVDVKIGDVLIIPSIHRIPR